jgi:hypothetical protein
MIGFTHNRQHFGHNNQNLTEQLIPAWVGLFVLDFRPSSAGEYTNVDHRRMWDTNNCVLDDQNSYI